ncbi:hypothetical protein CEB3_c43380 [Peptococcaceae bacterium CEB3]|nr:hypothetical protein CEB3_c43380 [Peptococcaceae bacterium CEB3]
MKRVANLAEHAPWFLPQGKVGFVSGLQPKNLRRHFPKDGSYPIIRIGVLIGVASYGSGQAADTSRIAYPGVASRKEATRP